MDIRSAGLADLPAILALQKRAFRAEAELVGDDTIPPLTQTLDGLTADLAAGVILKAVEDGVIVGSVRGRLQEETLHIGRLMVDPPSQNRGLGTALLRHLEALYPRQRYELFTSDLSAQNLSLYTRCGYREFDRRPLNDTVTLVFLEKSVHPDRAG
ncbi:MAG: GNAT family N-acetyltransferase [Propionibacteriaceae bacterium]|jgi:GNAT superfamily N-acetyltransferase|nr:GNAT family N-acetyltransferase [Propionibacteriaceae bacterium]